MNDSDRERENRRHPLAGSLRDFFREQLPWLSGDDESEQERAAIDQAMGTLIHQTNPAIAYTTARSDRQRLRKAINHLLNYIDQLIDTLPAAVEITRDSFAANDTLRSFFINAEEMIAFISHDYGLNKFIKQQTGPRPERVYALLAMAKSERREFGLGLAGDQVVRDVPQTSISFGNHRLHHLGLDQVEVLNSLKECLFDSYTHQVKQAMLAQACTTHSEPERYLSALEEELYHPERHLRTESNHLQVNRMGIIVKRGAKQPYCDLDIQQLAIGDAPSRTILPIIIPTAELQTGNDFLRNASTILNI